MEQEHQKQNEINYSVEVEKDGRKYVQSLAHQLAAYLCKQHFEEYRFSADYGFMSAQIYIETFISKGNMFEAARISPKKCVGLLLFDIEKNRMVLRKTNVNRSIHEFHADGDLDDCFGVQYDVFKYLRDSDLIQIHTVEEIRGIKTAFYYTISKLKALRNGRFLHFKGHGTQFFIPVADFRKSDGKTVVEKKKKRTYKGRKNAR